MLKLFEKFEERAIAGIGLILSTYPSRSVTNPTKSGAIVVDMWTIIKRALAPRGAAKVEG